MYNTHPHSPKPKHLPVKSILPPSQSSLIASHPASFQHDFWEGVTDPKVWRRPKRVSMLAPSQVPSHKPKLCCGGNKSSTHWGLCFTTSLPLHKNHQLLGAFTPTMIQINCGVPFGNRRVTHNLESKCPKSLMEWSLITSRNGRLKTRLHTSS